MSDPDEPDEISRRLDMIFADYFRPPTEMDLRGVDPATFALGLCHGFDTWQHVRVVANNRRDVATAADCWAEDHPSTEFLSRAVGTDERARGHRLLLDRAHPRCAVCEEQLQQLSELDPGHATAPDDIDIEWLLFQPEEVKRAERDDGDAVGLLRVDLSDNQPVTAEHFGAGEWRITVRHPSARQATLWIGWTGELVTEHIVTFENGLGDIDVDAPGTGARPEKVGVKITDPPEPP